MTTIVFPASVPSPSVSTITLAERRVLSDVNGGPQQARGIQNDYLGTQHVEWSLLDATAAAAIDDWWTNTLSFGGAWFVSTWPSPQGWISLVRRFVGALQWTHLAGGYWRLSATCQVRGRGLAPLLPTVWSPSRSNLAQISGNGAIASYFVSFGSGAMAMGTDEHSTGKKYIEYQIINSVRAGTSMPAVGFGVYPFLYVPSNASPTDVSFVVDSYGDYHTGAGADVTAQFNPGDVTMFAVDLDAGFFWYGVNGLWKWSGNPAAGTFPRVTLTPRTFAPIYWSQIIGTSVKLLSMPTDQVYAPPTGFTSWGI